jgi:hypothetical protein
MINKQSDAADGILAHHGVKGMKWGQHKAAGSAPSGSAPESKTKRAVNAVSTAINKKVDETTARDNAIYKARENHEAERAKYKQAKLNYKVDKAQYRIDKKEKGRAQAKAILNEHGKTKLIEARKRLTDNINKANEETSQEKLTRIIDEVMEQHLGPKPASATEELMRRRAGR